MAAGTVKWFNLAKGYGIIQPDSGEGCVRSYLGGGEGGSPSPSSQNLRVQCRFHRGRHVRLVMDLDLIAWI